MYLLIGFRQAYFRGHLDAQSEKIGAGWKISLVPPENFPEESFDLVPSHRFFDGLFPDGAGKTGLPVQIRKSNQVKPRAANRSAALKKPLESRPSGEPFRSGES